MRKPVHDRRACLNHQPQLVAVDEFCDRGSAVANELARLIRPAGPVPDPGWVGGCWIYRIRWTAAMDTAGLLVARHGTDYVPPLLSVRSTRTVDRVTVKMLPGQTIDAYAAVADRLAQTFGAADCRVRSITGRWHLLRLWLLICDPLEEIVAPFPPVPDCLTAGIPVALVEDGSVWRLPLLANHILVVGATGAGKASVIWSIVAGLVDHIAGLVKVWAVDPKGGMELAPGRHLFDRFAHVDSSAGGGCENGLARLLEDALVVMRERQDRLRGVTQLHTPSAAEPLIVLIIDELAALTGWVNDRTVKRRIESALGLLLSQGRAAGVLVVGAIQDPRKDVLPQRDLLPVRIGLRMTEAEHVNTATVMVIMAVGSGPWCLATAPGTRDASCDRIPHRLPASRSSRAKPAYRQLLTIRVDSSGSPIAAVAAAFDPDGRAFEGLANPTTGRSG